MREFILKMHREWGVGHHVVMFYRWGLPNGWHCGHWHSSFEDACGCLLERTYDA